MDRKRIEVKGLSIFGLVFSLVFIIFIIFSSSSFGEEKVIRFGAAVALTGKFSREGEMVKRAYDIWMQMANAKGGINVGGGQIQGGDQVL